MSRPLFTQCPAAWIVTPRTGASPAEYANAVERYVAPRNHLGTGLFAVAIVVLLVIGGAHLIGRIL